MAVNQKFLVVPKPVKVEPIQYLTDNAFRIIRRCDVDGSFPQNGIEHCFIVHDPDGYELDITVKFSTFAAAEIIRHCHPRLTFESSFWISAAERHLAEYLWRHGDFPPAAQLTIIEPNIDDFDLARRWAATPRDEAS